MLYCRKRSIKANINQIISQYEMRNKYLSRNDYFNILTVIDKIDKIKFQCATCTSLSQIIRDDCLFDLLRFSRNCTDWFFTRESEEGVIEILPILDEMKITVSFSIQGVSY